MNSESQIYYLLKLSLGCPTIYSEPLLSNLAAAGHAGRSLFLSLADSHHVVVRALDPLSRSARTWEDSGIAEWCDDVLVQEQARINESLKFLADICQKLESVGIQITVIKSLDHWPDIGNDLDLYTPCDQQEVSHAMQRFFRAWQKGRTWGDRLAQKYNFGVKGLAKSVEIHHGCLGQTGEHIAMARRFYTRRVPRSVGDYTFMVPASEERIIAATLQRMYRHLYIRACDIVNTHFTLESGKVNFAVLQDAADLGGIWPGVATYLRIVTEFVRRLRGSAYRLPQWVLDESLFGMDEVFVRGIWLRVPVRGAALLYGKQICRMATRRDVHAILRLSLLPPLASAARLSYIVTGNHSGIW